MYVLNELLTKTNELFGSDVHITVGLPPMVRLHGQLTPLGEEPLTAADTEGFAKEILGATKFKEYCDIAYAIPGVARFRVNLYKDRGTHAIALRLITEGVPTLDGLRHPSILKDLTKKRRGLVLVTGPTGSGKSTTLYSILNKIKNENINIETLEDPIEVAMDGLNQINLNEKIGITFESGLRSILRQDPDVIMVGEIRDEITAKMAVRAAITGHKVYSTIHTKSPREVILRLEEMGCKGYLIKDALVGIISQRLIKILCEDCKKEIEEYSKRKYKLYKT